MVWSTKIFLIIAYCVCLIINGVESNWNYENGQDIFIPFGTDLKPEGIDKAEPIWNLENGEQVFNPSYTRSRPKKNYQAGVNFNRYNGNLMFVPTNTDLEPVNTTELNREPLNGGDVIYNPKENVKPRVVRNDRKGGEIFRWYHPRTSKLNYCSY